MNNLAGYGAYLKVFEQNYYLCKKMRLYKFKFVISYAIDIIKPLGTKTH